MITLQQILFQIEMICRSCSTKKCGEHSSSKIIIDEETGLQFEAHCTCNHEGK